VTERRPRPDVRSDPSTARIALSGVSHGRGGTDILENVGVEIAEGETLAVIGPSGAGKTTLLRVCALLQRPNSGIVRIGGEDVWSRSEQERLAARRRVGMVFQEANLFDGTVRRNVEYGVQIRREWSDRIRRRLRSLFGDRATPSVDETLETVGLADAVDRDTASLSGGEAQRVAFARALAYDPDFLLLDEPTSDLDPRNTAVLEDAIDTARSRGIGVVVATHDMHQARRVADRVAVVIDGEIIENGPTERVFSEPNDPRARKFIDGELVY
jgi:tungstate transport system ATP-binding protein